MTNDGIASLSLFLIDRIHYSMLTVRRRRIRCWTFDAYSPPPVGSTFISFFS
ncbi:hypothetical protein D1AOALGA4SA_10767 [Olavius algarvensis Delta 1 endosymbiont]|nr:hypothetical protein D1AOALGA4SA_10767 [Olavius algarvensis Delta 1 endosymbiont]